MTTPPTIRARRSASRGSVLLEVLITVTLIAMFMALIGAQILSSVRSADMVERYQTAMLLAESLVSRLQAQTIELSDEQATSVSGDFGDVYPGWGWQVSTEPTDMPRVLRVTMQVLQGELGAGTSGVDDYAPVTEFCTYWTIPRKIDLAMDLGVSEEDIANLAPLLGSGFDPRNFDLRMLAGMNIQELMQLLPQLMPLLSAYGINPNTLDPEQVRSQLEGMLNGGGQEGGNGGQGGGQTGGDNSGGGNNEGNRGNNGNNNDGEQPSTGSFSMDEVVRLLNSGDKQGAMDYIRRHEQDLQNMGRGGSGGGGGSGRGGGDGGGGRGGGRGR